MCFYTTQTKSALEIENRFKAKFGNIKLFNSPVIYNAFTFPKIPVITNSNKELIDFYNWGLIPIWSKNTEIRKNTLNAKIETLTLKPSFRNCINNRCLVLVDGFIEWQWIDPKGKQKQKYLISLPDNSLFALAGLWNEWVNNETGELFKTFTIVTTAADELMEKIHNSKKRMPIVLSETQETEWLDGFALENFVKTKIKLKAEMFN
ncbi:MAG: SOS response-associated peptidase [Bacteroidetes bacterium]|nr:SOS response-associated peptidase [Bacteroidota bacterium]